MNEMKFQLRISRNWLAGSVGGLQDLLAEIFPADISKAGPFREETLSHKGG
jgi:hypothetical protein